MEEKYTKEMFRIAEKLSTQYNVLCRQEKDPYGNDICRIYSNGIYSINNYVGSLRISMWGDDIHFCYFSMLAGECHFKINPKTFEEDVDYAIRFLTR